MQVHYIEIRVKREESKVFDGVWIWLDVFRGEIRERRERICVETAQNLPFLQNEGSWGIYTRKLTLRLLMHLVGPPATLLTLAVSAFSKSNFRCIFEGLPRFRLS